MIRSPFLVAIAVLLLTSTNSLARDNYFSVTMDNDVLVGSDSGYTNGLYFSLYDVGYVGTSVPQKGFMTKPLAFLIPEKTRYGAINTYSFGQLMNTPADISIADPAPNSLPYSGILYVTNSYIVFGDNEADKISTTIGVVGPNSGAEQSQKVIHDLLGSERPQGWDTQIGNEIVFQFARGKLWRKWISKSGDADLLLRSEVTLGTLSSGASGGMILRYGRGLEKAYMTPLFSNSRNANPVSINGGWYAYIGLQGLFTANQIIADGNTFKESRSVEYDKITLGLSLGFAYSWSNYSLTLAIEDTSIDKRRFETAEDDFTRFGTLTFAVKY